MRITTFLIMIGSFLASITTMALVTNHDGEFNGLEWIAALWLAPMVVAAAIEITLGPPKDTP